MPSQQPRRRRGREARYTGSETSRSNRGGLRALNPLACALCAHDPGVGKPTWGSASTSAFCAPFSCRGAEVSPKTCSWSPCSAGVASKACLWCDPKANSRWYHRGGLGNKQHQAFPSITPSIAVPCQGDTAADGGIGRRRGINVTRRDDGAMRGRGGEGELGKKSSTGLPTTSSDEENDSRCPIDILKRRKQLNCVSWAEKQFSTLSSRSRHSLGKSRYLSHAFRQNCPHPQTTHVVLHRVPPPMATRESVNCTAHDLSSIQKPRPDDA
jgi:hypothetical protein